jgi:hypothetical protein
VVSSPPLTKGKVPVDVLELISMALVARFVDCIEVSSSFAAVMVVPAMSAAVMLSLTKESELRFFKD